MAYLRAQLCLSLDLTSTVISPRKLSLTSRHPPSSLAALAVAHIRVHCQDLSSYLVLWFGHDFPQEIHVLEVWSPVW